MHLHLNDCIYVGIEKTREKVEESTSVEGKKTGALDHIFSGTNLTHHSITNITNAILLLWSISISLVFYSFSCAMLETFFWLFFL